VDASDRKLDALVDVMDRRAEVPNPKTVGALLDSRNGNVTSFDVDDIDAA